MALLVQSNKLAQDLLLKLGSVVHQIQRERGCASLFIDSHGKIFRENYSDQSEKVDDTISDLQAFCLRSEVKNAFPPSFEGRLNFLFQKYQKMADDRQKTTLLATRYTKALNSYTFNYIIPTIDAMIEFAQARPENNSALVSAYANFLQWKERVGMARALGARGFYTFSFRNQEFCDRFTALIAEQRIYHDSFMVLASPLQIALLQDVVSANDLNELAELNKLIESDAPSNEIEKYSGEHWFDILTSLIDKLRDVEVTLVNTLSGTAKRDPVPLTSNAPATFEGARYKDFIKSIPTFSSIDDQDLDELLSFAQIKKHDKDKLLFLRDEPASRLYIVLSGWVKIFNGLETGEEAILQMIGSGEMLLESEILLGVSSNVSAQVVENAVLMSFPAPVIRQRIQSNSRLALNMLNAISLRSQRLIQQLELSRLKSAKERVGWFLLRLAINQKPADGFIFLPYDKAIIASYLDMRPETFSRTLQKFKAEGFSIASDHVVMPDTKSLCGFCDIELSSHCSHANSGECPRPDLLEPDTALLT